jgi:hypothetical protein
MSPYLIALIITLSCLAFIGLIIFFDIIISRRCFFCHKKNYEGIGEPFIEDNNLTKIKLPGTYSESSSESSTCKYYHRICLRNVLDNPEKYYRYVDNAVRIQGQIYTNSAQARGKVSRIQNQFEQTQPSQRTKATPIKTESKKEHMNRYSILKAENNNS